MIGSLKNDEFFIITETYTEKQLLKAEKILDYKFNELYKNFMSEIGAGYFTLGNEPIFFNSFSFENFYPVQTVINLTQNNEANQLPAEYIPFGADGSGSLFCFKRNTIQIVFLDHSLDSIDSIAEDFKTFLQLINQ